MKSALLFALFYASLLACGQSGNFLNGQDHLKQKPSSSIEASNAEVDHGESVGPLPEDSSSKGETLPAEDTVAEAPVVISGAYLVCGVTSSTAVVGCRFDGPANLDQTHSTADVVRTSGETLAVAATSGDESFEEKFEVYYDVASMQRGDRLVITLQTAAQPMALDVSAESLLEKKLSVLGVIPNDIISQSIEFKNMSAAAQDSMTPQGDSSTVPQPQTPQPQTPQPQTPQPQTPQPQTPQPQTPQPQTPQPETSLNPESPEPMPGQQAPQPSLITASVVVLESPEGDEEARSYLSKLFDEVNSTKFADKGYGIQFVEASAENLAKLDASQFAGVRLVMWNDYNRKPKPVTSALVHLLSNLHYTKRIPLYLVGQDLAFSYPSTLPEADAASWHKLIGLKRSVPSLLTGTSVSFTRLVTENPNDFPYQFASEFSYPLGINQGIVPYSDTEEIAAVAGSTPVLLARKPPQTYAAIQNYLGYESTSSNASQDVRDAITKNIFWHMLR